MRKTIAIVTAVALALAVSGCARDAKICGVTYTSYGLANQDDRKNPDVEYEVIWGNVFWGVVLFETIIAPIYFFGFSLFNPVGPKSKIKGAVGTPGDCPAAR